MRCNACGKLIRGKSIVDHIIPITPENNDDPDITLNWDNLQLLCLHCHNEKTFQTKFNFDLTRRADVNIIPVVEQN
ncbi:MAG: HNH endonuclease [Oscillospiraceae bacterium]|nr:HNH endonuclease [Oscillospiraceae bacterium]